MLDDILKLWNAGLEEISKIDFANLRQKDTTYSDSTRRNSSEDSVNQKETSAAAPDKSDGEDSTASYSSFRKITKRGFLVPHSQSAYQAESAVTRLGRVITKKNYGRLIG
ncbi:hypothetical protein KIN20_011669 [Parelaphostrongylus tenuis]|uniref:Uncharacterized protein n=1 Tax=Parelaphostrongylus tenuis TaxID=148309 RepID=A0AAD5QL59_PARTN|nr:hypothetical protein KIN20_011669 [Parelaphostrongylus tenuis]